MEKSPIRTAIYARYSSSLQKPTSIEDQVRRARELASAQGGTVTEDLIFSDEAITGKADEHHRPGLAALLNAMESKRIDLICLDELSRLYRFLKEQQAFLEKARACGVRVVDGLGFDSASPHARLISAIRGAMDESFLEELRHRQRRGIDGQVLRGFFHGRTPYGYKPEVIMVGGKRVGTRWLVDEATAAVVRRIFQMRSTGTPYVAIAEVLASEGVPSPGGLNWNTSSIQQILKKPIYTGMYILRAGSPDAVTLEHPELAIVDHNLFVICQAESREISISGRSGRKLWASGLAKCSCGHAMTAQLSPGSSTDGRVFCYNCYQRTRIDHRDTGSNGASLSVFRAIISALLSEAVNGSVFERFRERLTKRLLEGPDEDIATRQLRLKQIDQSIKRLTKLAPNVDDEIADEFARDINSLVSQKRLVKAEIDHLNTLNLHNDAKAVAAQLSADIPGLVASLFDGNVPVHYLRSALHRIFPEIIFEGRENRRISFWSIRMDPGIAMALAAGVEPATTSSEILSLRVFSPVRRGPAVVELLPSGVGYRFPTPGEKRCAHCIEIKPIHEFFGVTSTSKFESPYCRSCSRERWLEYSSKTRAVK